MFNIRKPVNCYRELVDLSDWPRHQKPPNHTSLSEYTEMLYLAKLLDGTREHGF